MAPRTTSLILAMVVRASQGKELLRKEAAVGEGKEEKEVLKSEQG